MRRAGMILVLFFVSGSSAPAKERVLWQLGTPDGSAREFALATQYAQLAQRFGSNREIVFTCGKSDPSRDWPYIHPGVRDGWAQGSTLKRTIRFQLPESPNGRVWLRLDLADACPVAAPSFAVSVNGISGRVEPACGSGGGLTGSHGKAQRVDLQLPAALFRQGENELVIANDRGAWAVYDALSLIQDSDDHAGETRIVSFHVKPTPLFVRQSDRLLRVLDATLFVSGPMEKVAFRIEGHEGRLEIAAAKLPPFGAIEQELLIPDSQTPHEVRVTALVGGQASSVAARVAPCRKWKVFIAASSHTDIGYTDLQPNVAELHNRNTDTAIDLINRYPGFAWNMEVAWQWENYLKARPEPQVQELLRVARQGKLGVQAVYANMLTGLMSHEAAARLTWAAAEAHRHYGIPYSSGKISDVPTLEASVPTILTSSGIRYFSDGMNRGHASTFDRIPVDAPCWWEGLDGSRVLTVFAGCYGPIVFWDFNKDLQSVRLAIPGQLSHYEKRGDYPYDAIYLHGAVNDNADLKHPAHNGEAMGRVQREWNQRYAYPQLIYCTNDQFFKYIEANCDTSKLPVVRGSGGTYWEDGAGSSAHETRLNRNAEAMLTDAEKLLSLSRSGDAGFTYPATQIEQAWRDCLLYDEHTWGANPSISQPENPAVIAQWKIKAQYAVDSYKSSAELLKQSVRTLAARVKHEEPALVVINANSWPRTDVVRVDLPEEMSVSDPHATACRTAEGTYVLVQDVPTCGYRTIKLVATGAAAGMQHVAEGTILESRFYRLQFDPASGAIRSVLDKQTGRELVDAKAAYRLNEYLYVDCQAETDLEDAGRKKAPDLRISTPRNATLKRFSLGCLGERMVVETSAAMTPRIVSVITVWNDVKRVDIENRLTKTQTYNKDAAYFAFPFAAAPAVFRYEIPCGVVRTDKDMLPGACLEWFTTQNFVEVESSDVAITWSSPDAPLACFQDINRGRWPRCLSKGNGHVYSYMMNNYWWTNYKAGQGGDFVFRYAFTSRSKSDTAESTRFGADIAGPLHAVVERENHSGPLTSNAASLLEIREPNVVLSGMRQAADGRGVVLHLRETAGQATVATVTATALGAHKATQCNLVEDPQGPLDIREGTLRVPLRAWGLATVTIE